MFFGFGRSANNDYLYNFVPFITIYRAFAGYTWNNIWLFTVNIFGNIGMFIPFGILLPIILKGSFKKAFVIFIIGIITLETAQLISRRGVFDADDILLNTIGFLIGYAMIKAGNKLINKFRNTE
jgi:glycopeptide antibiotics resistance protein